MNEKEDKDESKIEAALEGAEVLVDIAEGGISAVDVIAGIGEVILAILR